MQFTDRHESRKPPVSRCFRTRQQNHRFPRKCSIFPLTK